MKKLMMSLLGLFMVAMSQAALAAPAKVVYHVDFNDVTRYSATLTSINNLTQAYESELREYEVAIVFVGHGIRFVTDDDLKGSPYAADKALLERRAELKGRLDALVKFKGVEALLCDKTREEIKLDKAKVYAGVGFVASGVAAIADMQMGGHAYLKVQ
ncbi:MAG: DsrE family protein [Pseudomonadota bacterium]